MEVLSGELCGTGRCPGPDTLDSENSCQQLSGIALILLGWKQYHVAEKVKG